MKDFKMKMFIVAVVLIMVVTLAIPSIENAGSAEASKINRESSQKQLDDMHTAHEANMDKREKDWKKLDELLEARKEGKLKSRLRLTKDEKGYHYEREVYIEGK